MQPGRDEAVFVRGYDRKTDGEYFVLIYPRDMDESEALARLAPDFDPSTYERERETALTHWLDRMKGEPGHHWVLFKPKSPAKRQKPKHSHAC